VRRAVSPHNRRFAMGSCTVACGFPGCGRRYGHPDAARKHARRHHAEWVAQRDAEKLPCYTLVGDDDMGGLPLIRQSSDVGSDTASLTMPIQRPIMKKPPKAKLARSMSLPKDMDARARGTFWSGDALSPAFGRAVDDASSVMMQGRRAPNAFQLLVAAAIAASDNDESETASPRSTRPMTEEDAADEDTLPAPRSTSPQPESMNADDMDEPQESSPPHAHAVRQADTPMSMRMGDGDMRGASASAAAESPAPSALASSAPCMETEPTSAATPTASAADEAGSGSHFASRLSDPMSASGVAPAFFHARASSDAFPYASAAGASRVDFAAAAHAAAQPPLTAM